MICTNLLQTMLNDIRKICDNLDSYYEDMINHFVEFNKHIEIYKNMEDKKPIINKYSGYVRDKNFKRESEKLRDTVNNLKVNTLKVQEIGNNLERYKCCDNNIYS